MLDCPNLLHITTLLVLPASTPPPAPSQILTMHHNIKLPLLLPLCAGDQASVVSCMGHLCPGDVQPPPLLCQQEPVPSSHGLPVLQPRHPRCWRPLGLALQNRLAPLDDRNLPQGVAAALDPWQCCRQRDTGWWGCAAIPSAVHRWRGKTDPGTSIPSKISKAPGNGFWVQLAWREVTASPPTPTGLWSPTLTVHLQAMLLAAAASSVPALAHVRPLVQQLDLLHVHHVPSWGHQLWAPCLGGEGLTCPGKGQQLSLRLPAGQIPSQSWILPNKKRSLLQGDQQLGEPMWAEVRLRNRALPSFHQLREGRGIPWHSQASWTDCPSSTDTTSGSGEEKDGGTAGMRAAAH